jgi:hypothetical protein
LQYSLDTAVMTLASILSSISNLPTFQLCSSLAFLGLLSHWTYFIHSEHDTQVWALFLTLIGTPPAMTTLLYLSTEKSLEDASYIVATSVGSYLAALAGSMIIYRLWFHQCTYRQTYRVMAHDTRSVQVPWPLHGQNHQTLLPLRIHRV